MAIKFVREKWFYILVMTFALLVPLLVTTRYHFQIIIMGCLFSIATLGLNLILGYTGQASLAHAGFFGIGAYGVAMLTKAGFSFWLALPFSALVTAFISFLMGFPIMPLRAKVTGSKWFAGTRSPAQSGDTFHFSAVVSLIVITVSPAIG